MNSQGDDGMERTRRTQKEKLLQVEEPTLFEIINKDKFIEATKKHIEAISVVEGSTTGVYTFLASLYMANVISLEDLQQVGHHIKTSENTLSCSCGYECDCEDNDEED